MQFLSFSHLPHSHSSGTFFRLFTQLELIGTREFDVKSQLSVEFTLFIHFRDDRLQLRDLPEVPIPIPDEFQPWQVKVKWEKKEKLILTRKNSPLCVQPRIQLLPLSQSRTIYKEQSTNLSPRNGQLTVVQRSGKCRNVLLCFVTWNFWHFFCLQILRANRLRFWSLESAIWAVRVRVLVWNGFGCSNFCFLIKNQF